MTARRAEGDAWCPMLATRPGYHGRYHRGHARCVRARKRMEAQRGRRTP